MKKDFILPDIGEGIVECELVDWLVKEGDRIVEDQPICDVMTDKALVQIPAVYNGVVSKLYYAKGDIAKVHAPLFEMIVDVAAGDAPVVAAPVAPVAVGGKVVEDFILPDIGEGIVECEVVDWLVKEGDIIAEDQPVCDVMTDKALVQIPAKHPGKVVRLYTAKGHIAKVHAPLFAIEMDAALADAAPVAVHASAPISVQASTTVAAPAAAASLPAGHKALASPAVRRLARELSVDIHRVPGTGPKGRVFKQDVQAFVSGAAPAVTTTAAAVVTREVAPAPVVAGSTSRRVEPIKGIKAAMAADG